MAERVLVVGYSTRGLAEAVARSSRTDYQVVSLDYFGDLDQDQWGEVFTLGDFGEDYSPLGFLQAASRLSYGALAYTGGLEHHPDIVEGLAAGRLLLGNGGGALKAARDLKQLHRLLQARGISFPTTYYPWEGPPPPGRWLLKPFYSGGGSAIAWARAGEPVPPGYLLQEYREGTPASVSFVANGGETLLLGLSEQLCGWRELGGKDFFYCGNLVPLGLGEWGGRLPDNLLEQVQEMVAVISAHCPLRGLNGIDFLLTPQGECLFLEVNPRYCASMELFSRAYGLDLFDLHLSACNGLVPKQHLLLEEKGDLEVCWGKAILYAPWDLEVLDTSTWFSAGIRDIPRPKEWVPAGRPLCTLFARGSSREECLSALGEKRDWVLARTQCTTGGGNDCDPG